MTAEVEHYFNQLCLDLPESIARAVADFATFVGLSKPQKDKLMEYLSHRLYADRKHGLRARSHRR